jgi:hypothetical protein
MDPFERILLSQREEDCQSFLADNKEILSVTFNKQLCIPKFRFGNEFVSDFVLFDEFSSLGYQVTLVEIETATARAFTKNGKYAKRLNDAIGQINDWFAWISQNEEYFLQTLNSAARKSGKASRLASALGFRNFLPPHRNRVFVDAKIVIGRKQFLSESDNLRREAIYHSTNRTIEITHFDRLLDTHKELVETRRALDRNASTTVLNELSKSRFPQVRCLIAHNDRTDPSTLEYLAEDPDSDVVCAVIRNENTPPTILERLAQKKNKDLNLKLVERHELPQGIFITLFESGGDHLRRLILEHAHCPEQVLIAASTSSDRDERRRAAQHPNLSDGQVLSRLAADLEPFVRTGAALNAQSPPKVIAKLATDRDNKVRWAARYQNIHASEIDLIKGLETESDWARSLIAKHPNLQDRRILAELATDESWWVRVALAENKNLPSKILRVLVADIDKRVSSIAQARLRSRNVDKH